MDNDHKGPKEVHTNGDKALLAFGADILDGEREGIAKYSVSLDKRDAMLLEVCCILLWVKIGGHLASICI